MADDAPKPRFDEARRYRVKLNRVVEYPAGSGNFFRPKDQHEFAGKMCNEIADAVADSHVV